MARSRLPRKSCRCPRTCPKLLEIPVVRGQITTTRYARRLWCLQPRVTRRTKKVARISPQGLDFNSFRLLSCAITAKDTEFSKESVRTRIMVSPSDVVLLASLSLNFESMSCPSARSQARVFLKAFWTRLQGTAAAKTVLLQPTTGYHKTRDSHVIQKRRSLFNASARTQIVVLMRLGFFQNFFRTACGKLSSSNTSASSPQMYIMRRGIPTTRLVQGHVAKAAVSDDSVCTKILVSPSCTSLVSMPWRRVCLGSCCVSFLWASRRRRRDPCWQAEPVLVRLSRNIHTTPSGVSKAALPLSAHLTITKDPPSENRVRKTTQSPMQTCSHHWICACTKSSITFRSLPLQPILDGRQHERCNSWRVSCKNKPLLISRQRQQCSSHHCNNKALRKGSAEATIQLLLPPRAPAEKSARSHPPCRPGRRATESCGHRSL